MRCWKFWTLFSFLRWWWAGLVLVEWQTRVVVPIFERVCSSYRGNTHCSASPRKFYLECWKGDTNHCRIRRSNAPGCGTVDQRFILAGVLEGSWEFNHPVQTMCWHGKGLQPWGACGGHWSSMRYRDCCHEPSCPCTTKVRAVSAFSTQSQICLNMPLRHYLILTSD